MPSNYYSTTEQGHKINASQILNVSKQCIRLKQLFMLFECLLGLSMKKFSNEYLEDGCPLLKGWTSNARDRLAKCRNISQIQKLICSIRTKDVKLIYAELKLLLSIIDFNLNRKMTP